MCCFLTDIFSEKISVDACIQAGFEPNIIAVGEDMDAIKGLVTAGIGVSILPDGTFSDTTPRFTVRIPIESPKVKRTVGMITSKTRELSPTEKVFYQSVKELFSRLEQYKNI